MCGKVIYQSISSCSFSSERLTFMAATGQEVLRSLEMFVFFMTVGAV